MFTLRPNDGDDNVFMAEDDMEDLSDLMAYGTSKEIFTRTTVLCAKKTKNTPQEETMYFNMKIVFFIVYIRQK